MNAEELYQFLERLHPDMVVGVQYDLFGEECIAIAKALGLTGYAQSPLGQQLIAPGDDPRLLLRDVFTRELLSIPVASILGCGVVQVGLPPSEQ